MKKRVLSLITAAMMVMTMVPAIAFAESEGSADDTIIVEINETNFPDSTFRTWVRDYDDNYDDCLSAGEIADATSIYIDYKGVKDLTGIKYFTSLETLYCQNNQLTSLDVSGLASLKTLYCHENELTSLNLNGVTSLQILHCFNNQLTSLDVSGMTNLKKIDAAKNKLTSLNLSGVTNLETLYCYGNQLTSLDVSRMPNMVVLRCYDNQLTKLVLNGSAKYGYYDEDEGWYESLDVSANQFNSTDEITFNGNPIQNSGNFRFWPQRTQDVSIDATFPDPVLREKLRTYDYNDDGILSAVPSDYYESELGGIEYLYVNSSMVEDLTGIKVLYNLKTLDCSDSYITELPELPESLTCLDVDGNYLTDLPELPAGLEELDCDGNQLTSLPALPAGLKELYCYGNKLTTLPELPAGLTELSCSSNQLTSLPALPASLESLSCYGNQLANLPALPASLESLYCYSNQLTGLPALPASLIYLNCYNNQITSLPALPLKLQSLHADYNEISGVLDLSSLKFLTDVDVSDNRITGIILNPMAKYDYLYVRKNAMKSTADVTGRTDITWEQNGFYFNEQKTDCDLNGHKYQKKIRKAQFGCSGSKEYICSKCNSWDSSRYASYKMVDYPKSVTKTYTGKTLSTPKFVVKEYEGKTLKKNTDYTVKKVTSAKLKNIGKYKYKITLKGATRKGSTYVYVYVAPKSTSVSKLTAGKKQLTVKWKKQTNQTSGYQIAYSTSSKFSSYKTVTIKGTKSTSKVIKKLKSNKKYYVKVRTYKTVKGEKIYSTWSKAKYVKVK